LSSNNVPSFTPPEATLPDESGLPFKKIKIRFVSLIYVIQDSKLGERERERKRHKEKEREPNLYFIDITRINNSSYSIPWTTTIINFIIA